MKNINSRNEKLAQRVLKALEKRNFEAFFTNTKQDALKCVISLISKEESVSWGGSITLDELKIKDYLKQNGYKTIDRDEAKTPEERQELLYRSITPDVFLMSSNAISEDGELVNIDGLGNRLAALCFGAKKVIVVAGMNKVVKKLEDALTRARNFAAPVNAQRINSLSTIQTPCIELGYCMDCKSETSICCQVLTTRLSRPKGRIKVVLVNDTLGY